MDSGNEQLSLFGTEVSTKEKKRQENSTETPSTIIALDKSYRNAVDQYLSDGVQSAIEIAERLISEQGANPERFISGKPKIFLLVCEYLESLPNVKLLQAKDDKTDRIYQVETLN
jgi:hypothetical protein